MEYSIIVACDNKCGIGKNNQIPWYISDDLKNFRIITSNALPNMINAVIMGRKTWESIGSKPLKNRINIIVSNTLTDDTRIFDIPTFIVKSLNDAYMKIKENNRIDKVFLIGGGQLYREAIYDYRYTKIYLTMIANNYECDVFFPIDTVKDRYRIKYESEEKETHDNIKYKYTILEQKRYE